MLVPVVLDELTFDNRQVRPKSIRHNIIIIIMEKTEAGLERPLYPRNRCRITNTVT